MDSVTGNHKYFKNGCTVYHVAKEDSYWGNKENYYIGVSPYGEDYIFKKKEAVETWLEFWDKKEF